MDYYSLQLNVPKIENDPLGFDSLYYEPPFENLLLEFPPSETVQESDLLPLSSLHDYDCDHDHLDQLPRIDFQDFEDFGGVFSSDFGNTFSYPDSEDTMVDEKPHQTNLVMTSFHHHYDTNIMTSATSDNLCSSKLVPSMAFGSSIKCGKNTGKCNNKIKSAQLELDDIQKHFDFPIKDAAKELGVGVTRLKRRCRELNITRWPHRKFKSLKYLISNVKKMGLDVDEIRMLEEHQRLLEEVPDMELTEKAKKLRQACFKANFKNKRSLARAQLHINL